LGHGPLFSKCHFAESLNLNGMEWLELHGCRWGFLDRMIRLRAARLRRDMSAYGEER
jgi:hypothetical protein